MRRVLLLLAVASLFLSSFFLAGCQSGGVAKETYDKLKLQYDEIEAKYQEAVNKIDDALKTEELSEDLEAALAENEDLQAQIDDLVNKYVLEGATPAETAEKIIKYYHETHVYNVVDMFVCADMAAEVWNMLKAQGINALIMVGDLDAPIMDITECDHSWVLAEIAPGEYLALETTGGKVVPRSENAQYYRGWTFETPADEKDWQRLAREFNIRLEIVNYMNSEINQVNIEYNSAVDMYNTMVENGYSSFNLEDQETIINQLVAIRDRLVEIRDSIEEKLYDIKDQMESLATQVF